MRYPQILNNKFYGPQVKVKVVKSYINFEDSKISSILVLVMVTF